ncbi:MAG: hypothetical protein V4686_03850 [Patescibacteria group bacterium]
MKNTQQGFIAIVLIVLVALGVGGGVYYKTKVKNDVVVAKKDYVDQETSTVKSNVAVEKKDHTDTETSVGIKAPSVSTNAKVNSSIAVPVAASGDVKICTDAKCFTDAIDACSPAKFTQSSSGELLGSKIDVNFTYETKSSVKNCDFRLTVNSYNIAASAGLLSNGETFQDQNGKTVRFDEFYKELNIKSQANVGKSMLCPLNDVETKKAYIEIISNKEGYKFILAEDSCKGELITTMESTGKEI